MDNSSNPLSGPEFREIRRKYGLTQVSLAKLLDCSVAHISRLENGRTVPLVMSFALIGLVQAMENDLEAA